MPHGRPVHTSWAGRGRGTFISMKVATKFALAFVASGIFTVLVYSSVAASREVDQIETTVAEDLASLGRPLGMSILAIYEREGEGRAREIVAVHDRDDAIEVRWTWLDVDGNHSMSPRGGMAVVPSLVRGESRTWVGITLDGQRRVYVYVPLIREGLRPAALEFSRPLAKESKVFWSEIREQILMSTLVVAFAVAVALILSTMLVSRPLARVAEQARRIARGDLDYKLPVTGKDEVAALGAELNAMSDALRAARNRAAEETEKRVAALEELRHADRLRVVGTLASGIAHELGTPLNVISLRAKMLVTGEVPPAEAPESARIIVSQAERVTRIVRQLLDFARRRTPRRLDTDLTELALHTKQLLLALAKKTRVEIDIYAPAPVRLRLDPGQIEQALTNLVINAVHAMPNGGTVGISVREETAAPPNAPDKPRRCAVLEVVDGGTGIAPEHLERLYEPFFTTKSAGEGTGLGLPVTHGIIQDHGGWMVAANRPGGGARFIVHLPIEVESESPPAVA